ncbi:MAG: glycoside hydrolase family 2 TIM barrel-domain containing protein [Gemmatimonadota bacterium]
MPIAVRVLAIAALGAPASPAAAQHAHVPRDSDVSFVSDPAGGVRTPASTAAPAPREVAVLRAGWRFAEGEHAGAHRPGYDDSGWEMVSVPHDWAIDGPFVEDGDGSTAKLPWKGQGWYRRALDVPASLGDRRVYLIFDGVMAFPAVYVNGQLAGGWDYGYNSFYLDVTEHLRPGEPNLLAVHADTRPHDSRWYPGAGIYRKVRMVTVDPVHVDIWGTYVFTPIVQPHYADVRIRTAVRNATGAAEDVVVEQVILNPERRPIARDTAAGRVDAGERRQLEVTIPLTDPRRWDIDDPALYTARTTIRADGRVRDVYETPFGVRTMRFDPDHGFWLNERRVQLKGVNLHHGHGPLGATFYPAAERRQLEIMKAMGANAIRTAHNIEAPEVLALADSMGLLVFNEIFDKYDAKAGITEDTDFEAFARRNVRNWVLRDRNHPSVFLWSVGNEIGDVQWNIDRGFQKLHIMVNLVNRYDPTRPVTLANDNLEAPVLRAFDYYDVLSWNYDRRWRLARQMEPNKSVIISESASTVSTRGYYELPLPEEPTDFTDALQVSSYDLNAPWWAEIADEDFMWQQQEPYIAGEFVWTGFDYLGEPTPYVEFMMPDLGLDPDNASRSSYFGIVDLVGIPKDRYWLYRSYWQPDETTVHILPHWNWPDRVGQPVPVFVYTSGDCAELFLNGVSRGTDCKDPKSDVAIERSRLMWHDVRYEPGELRAVAYEEGARIGEATVRTAGEPARLRLTAERDTLAADGMDLAYILVEALDADGDPAPLADHRVRIEVDGPVHLAGAGNGNPQSFEPFQNDVVDLFFGKAMLIVRAAEANGRDGRIGEVGRPELTEGRARVAVSAEGLRGDAVTLRVRAPR